MNSNNQIITGRIASAHQAILNPLEYELHFGVLGWSLSYLGDDMSTMITDKHAEEIMMSMKVSLLREKTQHDIAEESEYQQSLLDEEAGDDVQGSPEAMDGHILEVLKSNAG